MPKGDKTPINPEIRAIEGKYRRDLAVLTARPKLAAAFYVSFALFDALLIFLFVWQVVLYLVAGSFADRRITGSLNSNAESVRAAALRSAALPLATGDVTVLNAGDGRYDLFAAIENENLDWYATFNYGFAYEDVVTDPLPGFVNPQSSRTLLALNTPADSRPSNPRLVITDFVWHRINRHNIPDPAAYLSERLNFTVQNPLYAPDVQVGTSQVGRAAFTVTNQSAYGYWEPQFVVKLTRGSAVVNISQITAPSFRSGETRNLEARFFGNIPTSASVVIEPVLNPFDQAAFMDPHSEETMDVGR